jgi:predicted nuclease of predicted toxin-antitoxin system
VITFLVDENLSPHLTRTAQAFGHPAFHINHRGWSSLPDPDVLRRVLDEDLTLVTNNWAGTTSGPCWPARRCTPGSW